jgi:GNAT superfamily N-acetyltransferase
MSPARCGGGEGGFACDRTKLRPHPEETRKRRLEGWTAACFGAIPLIEKGHLMKPVEITVCRVSTDFAEWGAVRTLIQKAFAYMEGRIEPPSSALRLTPQSMAADAADGALLLAKSGSTLVGCVFVRPKDDALYIGKLAVRPGLHGRGIGKALVAAARAEARALGLKALELQARIELTENHAAFAQMGFKKTGETAHQGYERATSITMRAPV